MIINYIFCILFILLGILPLYSKYRIILGGKLYEATACSIKHVSNYRGSYLYRYEAKFLYENKDLYIPALNGTLFPKKIASKPFKVYYNPKYPLSVVKPGIGVELGSLFLIFAGIAVLLNP